MELDLSSLKDFPAPPKLDLSSLDNFSFQDTSDENMDLNPNLQQPKKPLDLSSLDNLFPKEQQPLEKPTEEVRSNFGIRSDPFTKQPKFHNGIDLKLSLNSPVKSLGNGTVINVGDSGKKDYGKFVTVDYGGGLELTYGHLNQQKVEVGDKISSEAIIGLSGNTGRSKGPHLHIKATLNGAPVDPQKYFSIDNFNQQDSQTALDQSKIETSQTPTQKLDLSVLDKPEIQDEINKNTTDLETATDFSNQFDVVKTNTTEFLGTSSEQAAKKLAYQKLNKQQILAQQNGTSLGEMITNGITKQFSVPLEIKPEDSEEQLLQKGFYNAARARGIPDFDARVFAVERTNNAKLQGRGGLFAGFSNTKLTPEEIQFEKEKGYTTFNISDPEDIKALNEKAKSSGLDFMSQSFSPEQARKIESFVKDAENASAFYRGSSEGAGAGISGIYNLLGGAVESTKELNKIGVSPFGLAGNYLTNKLTGVDPTSAVSGSLYNESDIWNTAANILRASHPKEERIPGERTASWAPFAREITETIPTAIKLTGTSFLGPAQLPLLGYWEQRRNGIVPALKGGGMGVVFQVALGGLGKIFEPAEITPSGLLDNTIFESTSPTTQKIISTLGQSGAFTAALTGQGVLEGKDINQAFVENAPFGILPFLHMGDEVGNKLLGRLVETADENGETKFGGLVTNPNNPYEIKFQEINKDDPLIQKWLEGNNQTTKLSKTEFDALTTVEQISDNQKIIDKQPIFAEGKLREDIGSQNNWTNKQNAEQVLNNFFKVTSSSKKLGLSIIPYGDILTKKAGDLGYLTAFFIEDAYHRGIKPTIDVIGNRLRESLGDFGKYLNDDLLKKAWDDGNNYWQSNVAEANAQPIEIIGYHGSIVKGLEVLDPNVPAIRKRTGPAGVYFTDNPLYANNFTRLPNSDIRSERGEVLKAKLTFNNPLDITEIIAKEQENGLSFGEAKRKALESFNPKEHDGIIFNGNDSNPAEYIVTDPKKIEIIKNKYKNKEIEVSAQTTGIRNSLITREAFDQHRNNLVEALNTTIEQIPTEVYYRGTRPDVNYKGADEGLNDRFYTNRKDAAAIYAGENGVIEEKSLAELPNNLYQATNKGELWTKFGINSGENEKVADRIIRSKLQEQGYEGVFYKYGSVGDSEIHVFPINDINNTFNSGLSPDAFIDFLKLNWSDTKDFFEFSKELVQRFGEAIKPHLQDLWIQVKGIGKDFKASLDVAISDIKNAENSPAFKARKFERGFIGNKMLMKNPESKKAIEERDSVLRIISLNTSRMIKLAQESTEFGEVYNVTRGAQRARNSFTTSVINNLHSANKSAIDNDADVVAEALFKLNESGITYKNQADLLYHATIGLTPEQITAFKSAREAENLNLDWRRETKLYSMRERANRLDSKLADPNLPLPEFIKVSKQRVDLTKEMDKVFRHFEEMKNSGYISLQRQGNLVAYAEDSNGNKSYQHFETRSERDNWITQQKSNGFTKFDLYDLKKPQELRAASRNLTPGQFEDLIDNAGVNPNSPEIETLRDEVYSRFPSFGYELKRDFTPGYDRNWKFVLNSIAHQTEVYASSFYSRVAGNEATKKLTETGLRDSDYRLYQIAQKYIDDEISSPAKGVASTILGGVRKAVYLFNLGYDINQLYLNAVAQPISQTYSYFARVEGPKGQRLKLAEPEKYFAKAWKLAGQVAQFNLTGKGNVDPEFMGIYDRLKSEGVIEAEFNKSLLEIEAQKSVQSQLQKKTGGFFNLQKQEHWAGTFMRAGEKTTRTHVAAEAFLVGKKFNLAGEKLVDFIVRAVDATQSNPTRGEAPAVVRQFGEGGKLVYQFNAFNHMWMENLVLNVKSDFKNRSIAATSRHLAPLLIMGGIRGLPLTGFATILYTALTGEDPKKKIHQYLNNDNLERIVLYGITKNLAMSQKLTPSFPVLDTMRIGSGVKDTFFSNLESSTIPALSTAGQITQGLDDLTDKKTRLKGLAEISPRVLKGPITAARTGGIEIGDKTLVRGEGYRTGKGETILGKFKISPLQQFFQSFNITPSPVSDFYEQQKVNKLKEINKRLRKAGLPKL